MEILDPCIPIELLPAGSKAHICNSKKRDYKDLPAIITPRFQVITRWSPTPEERQKLANGEDIFVTILAAGMINPISLSVGLQDWTK